jgi:hypothetical protein
LRQIVAGEVPRDREDVDVLVGGPADESGWLYVRCGCENQLNAVRVGVIRQEALRDIRLLVEIDD